MRATEVEGRGGEGEESERVKKGAMHHGERPAAHAPNAARYSESVVPSSMRKQQAVQQLLAARSRSGRPTPNQDSGKSLFQSCRELMIYPKFYRRSRNIKIISRKKKKKEMEMTSQMY